MEIVNTGESFGQTFEGISYEACGNARKIFMNTWIDNQAISFTKRQGSDDKETKKFI